jgi:hypothetical protein
MRHFLVAGPVARLAGGMAQPAGPALLIALARPAQRDPPRVAGAGVRAVPLAAIAPSAQEEQLVALQPAAEDQPQ